MNRYTRTLKVSQDIIMITIPAASPQAAAVFFLAVALEKITMSSLCNEPVASTQPARVRPNVRVTSMP